MTRPGMSDGRLFTSYVPSCMLNQQLQKSSDTETNAAYRQFLQKNASDVMAQMAAASRR